MVASTMLMSYSNRVYANTNSSWDPLSEALPINGSQAPVSTLLNKIQGGKDASCSCKPTPFQDIQDPQAVSPDEPVDLATGALKLNDKDMTFPTFGPPLEVNRSYSSNQTNAKGMFGYGWNIPQERYIQLFADFTMTDFQSNGSKQNFLYTKNNPDLLVDSFDGDPVIYYPLDQGYYTPQDTSSKFTLTRRGAEDYLMTDPLTGMKYAFKGYKAPWRAQPADAGKLMRYANLQGFVIYLDYDAQGRITTMRSSTAPKLQFQYQGTWFILLRTLRAANIHSTMMAMKT